ncbi:MAG: SPOR domain-containing protein [Spirochaetaceae bacterium]|nr:MAG: SPOR domain-containing protein [Spirochaetaceae bacterium]
MSVRTSGQYSAFFAVFLVLLSSTIAHAEPDYRVVLGSFLVTHNARGLIDALAVRGYEAETTHAAVHGRAFHRVYLTESFPSAAAGRAMIRQLEQDSSVYPQLCTDFWVLDMAPDAPLPSPTVDARPEVAATAIERREVAAEFGERSNVDIPFGEDTPYAVRVDRFRVRSDATSALNSPALQEFDTYLLRAYERGTGIHLDLMIGAFEQPEMADEVLDTLVRRRIGDPQRIEWDSVAASARAYDELPVAARTEFLPPDPAWNIVPLPVQDFLSLDLVPVGYRVSELIISDISNPASYPRSPAVEAMLSQAHAGWSMQVMQESVIEARNVFVQGIAMNEPFTYSDLEAARRECALQDLPDTAIGEGNWRRIDGAVVEGELFGDEEFHVWTGLEIEPNRVWILGGDPVSLENLLSGERLRPVLRSDTIIKTLSLLPDEHDAQLWAYHFHVVGEDYVESKGYAEWAVAMEGHWQADIVVDTTTEPFWVGAFDLTQEFEAERVHAIFRDGHERRISSAAAATEDRIFTIRDQAAVYLHGTALRNQSELSFQAGSFIIALNALQQDGYTLESMVEWADRLRVWDFD